jgi:cell wall-associated NlpC family hydrolase
MKKLYISIPTAFLLLALSPLFISSKYILSLAVTSNCAVTKIGNAPDQPLPPQCNQHGGNQDVINLAKQHLNATYVWGAPDRDWASHPPQNAPQNFDCSGFAGWVWYWATNGRIKLAGQTSADWNSNSPQFDKHPGDTNGIQPGDLIYFSSDSEPSHVGIWEGQGSLGQCTSNDCFLEEYSSGQPGRENSLSKATKHVVGYLHPK